MSVFFPYKLIILKNVYYFIAMLLRTGFLSTLMPIHCAGYYQGTTEGITEHEFLGNMRFS